MRYASVCSGIEAASIAWEPLGWKPVFFSEVEPFPCAVLKHHWPRVPNLGDMTKINGAAWKGMIDVLVGGTPCQAFSIAGARRGLNDDRGNLTLTFARLADDINPEYVVYENVPGILSDKTNAFGCLLGMLADEDDELIPPGGKWSNAGYVLGPKRAIAWRVLDAQYFGVAQRRRRVFLVACPRDGADPRAVLFEREGVRRDFAPSRETGEGVARGAAEGIGGGDPTALNWQENHNFHASPCATDSLRRNQTEAVLAFGGGAPGPIPTTTNLTAHGGGRYDFESETFVAYSTKLHNTKSNQAGKFYEEYTPSLQRNSPAPAVVAFAQNSRDEVRLQGGDGGICGVLSAEPGMKQTTYICVDTYNQCVTGDISQTLCSRGDSSGGNAYLVPAVVAFDTTQITSPANYSSPQPGDPCHPLAAGAHPPAVAISLRGREGGATAEVSGERCPTIRASQGGGDKPHILIPGRVVRRLTCTECERLQGFPDGHTLIPWRGKPASECPDGPRYKSLGNSMATPCMRWIGNRIDLVRKRPRMLLRRALIAVSRITESILEAA